MKCAGETFKRKHYKDTFKMICICNINFLLSFILFSLNFDPCFSECARAEYETGDKECCPMCAPGNRVYRDCTEYTSTTCVPCMGATFLDAPNGLKECFICVICDPGLGLRVKTACTRTSDAVCEPLRGYYCKDENRGSCIRASKHTKCSPGQYIKHTGTADKDAVCDKCADGTYSNGTLQICQPHTKCEDQGLREEERGTAVSDTVCGDKPLVGLIVGIFFFFVALVAALLIFLIVTKRVRFTLPCTARDVTRKPQQESAPVDTPLGKITHSDRSCNPGPETALQVEPQETSEDELAVP